MLALNTNTASAVSHNALTKTSRALNTALERLSTGQRINASTDDARGAGDYVAHDVAGFGVGRRDQSGL